MTRELASTISQENLRSIDFGRPQHLRTVHSTAVQYQYQYSCTAVLAPVHTYWYIRTVLVYVPVLHVLYMYSTCTVLVHLRYVRTVLVLCTGTLWIYVASTISPTIGPELIEGVN